MHLLVEFRLLKEKNHQGVAREEYFKKIKSTVCELHLKNYIYDKDTGKKVSFGIIRMANIPPCVALAKFLIQSDDWPQEVTPKIMAYHSRQVLLLRHHQEKHLDAVLKRKQKFEHNTYEFRDVVIRAHIDAAKNDHVIFILVATPVEEVGRDHDFDWAIIEPSSYRSIIQLAGRVRRHRKIDADITDYNMAIMQYNLKGLRQDGEPVYCRPGYENSNSLKLDSPDLCKLVNEDELKKSINATPRIQAPENLSPKKRLIDLEHQALSNSLTNYTSEGPKFLQAWLNECWWLTALPQQFNRFRDSRPEITLYLIWKDGRAIFHKKHEQGVFVPREGIDNINRDDQSIDKFSDKLWLVRSYEQALQELSKDGSDEQTWERLSKKYGEITLPDDNQYKKFFYSDQLGLFLAL